MYIFFKYISNHIYPEIISYYLSRRFHLPARHFPSIVYVSECAPTDVQWRSFERLSMRTLSPACASAHVKEGITKDEDKRAVFSRDRAHVAGRISRREGGSSAIVLARGGFILRRFTMLYGVGLVAPTNNCQLNVLDINPARCQLRESSGYSYVRGDFNPFLLVFCAPCR